MEEGLGEMDLEEVMERTTDPEKTTATTTMVMTTTTMTASLSTHVVTVEVYSKPYTKSAELRGE